MADKREKLIEHLEYLLGEIRLTCSCVNWMGGCKEEARCSYGNVIQARETLDKLKKLTEKEVQK